MSDPSLHTTKSINGNEWRVIGMSRSGNHAIINWLLAHSRGRTCFLNCAEPKNNPFCWARPLGTGSSATRRDILILRDPFNLFASRLKCGIGQIPPSTAARMWKQHARQFLGLRSYLPNPTILISYKRWFSRKSYRRHLMKQLGLRFSDQGFHEVSDTAGGSSFDGLRFRRRAARMKVLDRWRTMADDDAYRRLFDEEIVELSAAAFGRLPAAEQLGFATPELV